jgi:tetratricopeptide (TPR) repeat protein
MGKVDAVRVLRADDNAFDSQLDALQRSLATSDLDLSRNALAAGALLFNRYYDDSARRARSEGLIDSASGKLPMEIRFDHIMELAGFALEHKDSHAALQLVDQAQALLDGVTWMPENYIPFAARLAALRFRAGAEKEGRASADAGLALFDEKRERITDILRAGAIRPLAEAYAALGDNAKALALYKRAVDEGVGNPNSRPRAEDLVATCLSLAKIGLEPDAELKAKLEKASKGLGSPW